MNVIILGSGGCVSTPRACCNCRVCTEARQKGNRKLRKVLIMQKADLKSSC